MELRDELTGELFDFTADVIVNTTGAWVDLTNQAMGAASAFHGRHQGIAHRAGPPGTAGRLQRPRDLLRTHRRPDRADLPDGGPGPGGHHRRRRRHGRGRRVHRGGDRLLLRPDRPRLPGHHRGPGTDRLHLLRSPPAAPARRHPARVRQPRLPDRAPRRRRNGAGRRRRRAQPRRRKVDHLPGPRRTPEQRRPRRTRDGTEGFDGETRHRRRRRLPRQRGRRAALDQGAHGRRTRRGPHGRAADPLRHPRGGSHQLPRRTPEPPRPAPALDPRTQRPGTGVHGPKRADRAPGRRADPPHLPRLPRTGDGRAAERGCRHPRRPAGLGRGNAASEISHAQEVLKRFHGVQVHSLVS